MPAETIILVGQYTEDLACSCLCSVKAEAPKAPGQGVPAVTGVSTMSLQKLQSQSSAVVCEGHNMELAFISGFSWLGLLQWEMLLPLELGLCPHASSILTTSCSVWAAKGQLPPLLTHAWC